MYSFKVNDIEIGASDGSGPSYVLAGTKIQHRKQNDMGNTATVIVESQAVTLASIGAGDEIIISRGENDPTIKKIFKGNIKKISKNDDDTITLLCTDPLQKLKYQIFTTSYDRNVDPQLGELSEIFKDIAERGGFTVSRIRSGRTSGDITADKFKSISNTRLNRLSLIQKLLDWIFYYDYDNDWIRLEPKGSVTYGTTLEVGSNIRNYPVWEEDIESMRNNITIKGASKFDTRTDTFTGDGDTKSFTLTYTPETIELTVGGVLKILGVEGATESYDYVLSKFFPLTGVGI
jgi:hypothetical protein